MRFRGSTVRSGVVTVFTSFSFLLLAFVSGSAQATPKGGPGDSPDTISSPSSFKLDYESRLASDGKHLWLATTGKSPSGQFRSQTQKFNGDRWISLPGRPKTGIDYPLQLVSWKAPTTGASTPCLGDTRNSGARIRCLQGDTWLTKKLAGELDGMNLSGLKAEGSELIGLFVKWNRKPTTTEIRVARLSGNRFVPYGKPLRFAEQVQGSLGQETSDSSDDGIDVALQVASGENAGQRTSGRLDRGTWTFSKLPSGLAAGPQLSGSVRTKTGLFFPVSEAELPGEGSGKAWPMSVFEFGGDGWSRVGGKPASNRIGNAQGGIDAVGRDVWVTWTQSSGQTRKKITPDRQYASKVKSDGTGFGKRIVLWRGQPIGPGINQAVEYRGKPVFLYMRTIDRSTRATVDFTRGGRGSSPSAPRKLIGEQVNVSSPATKAGRKETMLYHGNGFAIRPVNLYNWEYNGFQSGMSGGQIVAGLKGEGTNRWSEGTMRWRSWGKKKAVGVGGLHTNCGSLPKAKCQKSPWSGTPKVKVLAFAPRRGHFSKLRISDAADPEHFMVLRFIGKHLTPAWRIVREEA